jgi:(p)ppGpp synthase/HD superfamily hydrolase
MTVKSSVFEEAPLSKGSRALRGAIGPAVGRLRASEMDAALLSFAISDHAAAAGITSNVFRDAMMLAAYVHRDDRRGARRDLPRDVYITHPYRNVLRLLRYGCRLEQVLIAAALHDTVEDHPEHIVELFESSGRTDRTAAVELLARHVGAESARIVAAVTNPDYPPGAPVKVRHRLYAAHVANAIEDPNTCVVKFVDYVDNAASLPFMTEPDDRQRRARKYAPLVEVFRLRIETDTTLLPVSSDGLRQMRKHLATIETRLAESAD